MKTFLIAGSIVDTDADRETFEDVTPVQINSFLKTLEPGEGVELEITSYGGSVTAGLAICNLLKKTSAEGHRTASHVIGIAASMASAIACACDELKIDANAFLMVHNPWTITMGNANDMRKEADTLDKYRDALLSIYRTKFGVSDEVIKKMLDDETWIIGAGAPMYELEAEVIPTEEPLKIAASTRMPKFMKTPKALKEIIMEKEEEKTAEQMIAEAVQEEPKAEEPVEETVTMAECEKRVSGMQSAMAKQIDAMKKDYEAKIQDFQIQIKAKDEELTKARAEVTSLSERLEKSEKELSETASALAEKENALAVLNANVNTPSETTDWKSLKGKAFFDWYKKNH